MRRKLLMVLLATGTVVGFGSGFARLAWGSRCHGSGWGKSMAAAAPCWQRPPASASAAQP